MQLAKALSADGRWRIVIFTGDIRESATANKLAKVRQIPFCWSSLES
jgi:hypothetical protein